MNNMAIDNDCSDHLQKNCYESTEVPISVIIPSYNSREFLVDCIESINSDFPPNEIIIIDDKSTDGSEKIAQMLSERFENIKIIYHEVNGGAAAARKSGIIAASNDIVAIVDADDFIEKDAINEAYRKLENLKADMCIWDMWCSENKKAWPKMSLCEENFPKSGRQAVIDTLESWKIHPLGVAKKSLYLQAYESFQLDMMLADELLTRIIFSKAEKIVFCAKKYFYRINANSTTRLVSDKHLSVLKSNIWLYKFALNFPEANLKVMGKRHLHVAWNIYRNRRKFNSELVNKALVEFIAEFKHVASPNAWVWRYPKHAIEWLWLNLCYLK